MDIDFFFGRLIRTALYLGLVGSLAATETAAVQFRGDAARSGVFASPGPRQLTVRWKFQTAEPIVASPTIANGTVYIGSADNFLYAIDARTGSQRWKFDAHGNVNSSPAVSGGIVYVVSLDGNLYAVDAATGTLHWKFATRGERRNSGPGINYAAPAGEVMPDPWDFFLSSPAVKDGVVFFGSGDHFVYAVGAATGEERWKYKTGHVVHASPTIAEGVVYVGSFDGNFYALDAATGDLRWKYQTGQDEPTRLMTGIPGSAAVSEGTVYFGSRDAFFYALSATTGELRWKHSADGSWVVSSPAVVNGTVYFTTSDSLKFEAMDAKTGRRHYSLPFGLFSFSSPAVAGEMAYFGTFDGKLFAVDLVTHRYTAEFSTPASELNRQRFFDAAGKLKTTEVWVGDTLDDTITALRGKLFPMGSILSSPVVHAGVVYVGSADGALYALGE